jgi:hypothetical protein
LWFRLSGSFLLRFADRQFLALLFQLPPRSTRAEALAIPRRLLYDLATESPTFHARRHGESHQRLPALLRLRLGDLPRCHSQVEVHEFSPKAPTAAQVQLLMAREHAAAEEIHPTRRAVDEGTRLWRQTQMVGKERGVCFPGLS